MSTTESRPNAGTRATSPHAVLADIAGGLVAATSCLPFSIANGALIYSGTFQPMLVAGIAAGLLTTAVATIVLALTSTFKPVVATANSTTAAPLGAIMVSISPALAHLSPEAAAATVFALVAVTTVATGLVLVALGAARLGQIVRFIPFPIVAGFMGVTGTLLSFGALRFGTGVRIVWRDLPAFLAPDKAILLALTIAFAAVLSLVTRRFKHPLVLPGVLLAAILATVALVYASGHSIETTPVAGLFLASKTGAVPVTLLPLHPPLAADWALIPPLVGSIAAYVVLVVLATLLTSSGLEAALNTDADYDRELRAQGLACALSGFGGGFVGNPSVGATMASVAIGAKGRLGGITNGIVMLIALAFALPLIVFVPRFVVAGLLLHVGIWVIVTWCLATRTKMPRGEWLVVLGIVAVTVWAGLVAAVFAGLIAGCILFALEMSRIRVVRREYGPDRRASTLVRPSEDLAILSRDGGRVRFVELAGTLFFGSAYQLLAHVRRLVEAAPLDMLVLDLTAVTGCDSSTTAVITRMRRLLARKEIAFAVAGGPPQMLGLLRSAGCLAATDKAYTTRNEAIEAAERLVLDRVPRDSGTKATLDGWLADALGDAGRARALIGAMVCHDHAPGSYLCREGEPTTTLLFIESGRVAVMVGEPAVCVRVFGPHTIAGEHGFVLGLPRTASLKVEEPARVWSLDRPRFDRLQADDPALVIALMRDIVRLQSERLAFATRQNAALA